MEPATATASSSPGEGEPGGRPAVRFATAPHPRPPATLTHASTSPRLNVKETNSFQERRSLTFGSHAPSSTSHILRSQHTVSNLLAFTGPGQITDLESFKRDVQNTRHRIHNISRRTLDPRSRFVRAWDLITVMALLFTTFVTPFEVAFFDATACARSITSLLAARRQTPGLHGRAAISAQ